MLEIVGGVHRDGEFLRRQYAGQPERELRPADAAGKRDNFTSRHVVNLP